MSQTTTIQYFSANPSLISRENLVRCFDASGTTKTLSCMRASCQESPWEAFKNDIEFHQKWESLGGSLSPTEAALLVSDEFEISFDLGSPPMAAQIHQAVLNEIPPSIFGEHCPGNMSIIIGWHDIYDTVENEEGHFIARASFSVRFWGYSIPSNIAGYRDHYFKLPAAILLKQQLESILGPLDACILLEV